MSLKNKRFVNNIKGYFLETEEILDTIYGKGMHNESYINHLNKPFMVGMSRTQNTDEEKSSSGFFITLKEIDFLEQYVVVGKVYKG